jgi:hypothetical protein
MTHHTPRPTPNGDGSRQACAEDEAKPDTRTRSAPTTPLPIRRAPLPGRPARQTCGVRPRGSVPRT